MESLVTTIVLAIVAFASTNIDDAFVLVGFFSDKNFRPRDVVIGQYTGIGTLCAISGVAALISLVIPSAYIGLLGLIPIAIGAKRLTSVWNGKLNKDEDSERASDAGASGRALAVAAVTMANGGDNIAVYTALFATRRSQEAPLIGLVFAVMTGLWCLTAQWLVNHRALGAPIRHHSNRLVPFILIGLGVLVLVKTGMVPLL